MPRVSREWVKAAEYDLAVIDRIIDDEFLSSMVLFHAQQAIEKLFKALCEEHSTRIPKVHDLVRLHAAVREHLEHSPDLDLLELVNSAYIEARYPSDLGLLPQGVPSMEDARQAAALARDVYAQVDRALGSDDAKA